MNLRLGQHLAYHQFPTPPSPPDAPEPESEEDMAEREAGETAAKACGARRMLAAKKTRQPIYFPPEPNS